MTYISPTTNLSLGIENKHIRKVRLSLMHQFSVKRLNKHSVKRFKKKNLKKSQCKSTPSSLQHPPHCRIYDFWCSVFIIHLQGLQVGPQVKQLISVRERIEERGPNQLMPQPHSQSGALSKILTIKIERKQANKPNMKRQNSQKMKEAERHNKTRDACRGDVWKLSQLNAR